MLACFQMCCAYEFRGRTVLDKLIFGRDCEESAFTTGMVRPEGIEPPAYRFEACRSIHLSYGRAAEKVIMKAA